MTTVEEQMLAGRGGRQAFVRALEQLLEEGRPMWSFSYTGRGCADQGEARVNDAINAAAEKQIAATPERAHAHIRAAQDYVKALARSTNSQVSIVAEGWVEEDGHAGTTVNVSIVGAGAPAET